MPSRHKTQYFEMFGQWALYDDGWMLSTKVNRAPWQAFGMANPDPLNNQVFQLYDLTKDFSQAEDIAAQNPQKVIELKRTMPMILQWDESVDIGSDMLTGVNDADYQPPFPLTAKLDKLTIKIDRPELTPEDIKALDGKPLRHVQPGPH